MEEHLMLLQKYKFDKRLKKLNKKLKNKRIILYGAGSYLSSIQDSFDLSNLNIVGISDKKFQNYDEGKQEKGYDIVPINKIIDYEPDYVLVSALNYVNIIDYLENDVLKKTKIKVCPLVEKTLIDTIREIL